MARMVKCVKLQKELPGLEYRPFNNELGQKIYDNVSQEAWKMWLEHFKMIMNEYRLAGASKPTRSCSIRPTSTSSARARRCRPITGRLPRRVDPVARTRRDPSRLLLRAWSPAGR